jgi:DNA (cytosine-5)-methyltransferase 1
MFRRRAWVRRFLDHHNLREGDVVALERHGQRDYHLAPLEAQSSRRRAAEFFAGIGLVRIALEQHGWQVVFANDIDDSKAKMYRDNWPDDDALMVNDIHALNADELPDCDMFTASFPCNDLSVAGRRQGLAGKESSAFWGLVGLLKESGGRRPRFVLLENVVGFLTSHGGRDFETALRALGDLGYAVDAFVLNAVHWVPQSRPRLFVVGDLDPPRDRQTTGIECDARPAMLTEFINTHPHLTWHLRDLPSLPAPTARLPDILEDLPEDDPHWWSRERVEYFMGQLSERHAAQAAEMINGKRYSYATAFRRVRKGRSMAELRTDGIAGCLRTPRGGSGRQILFRGGRGRYDVRLLTARECARLQGVPDSYVLDVRLNQALFGFGDAVCVPAVEWLLTNAVGLEQHVEA